MKNCKKPATQKNLEEVLKDWEMKLVWDTSFGDGFEKGELAKALKVAKNMLALNLAIEIIVETTGLSLSEIEKLANPLLNQNSQNEFYRIILKILKSCKS